METEQLPIEWHLGQGGNKKEIKDILGVNENECTTYPSIGGTMGTVLRGNFIALSAYIYLGHLVGEVESYFNGNSGIF